jgi:flagellar biosynthesis/type III secretory pathway chaperone
VIDVIEPQSASHSALAGDLDNELANLLCELSDVQGELLRVLGEKRQCILQGDTSSMARMASRETEIIGRLEACHRRRSALLNEAKSSGIAATTLTDLASRISPGRGGISSSEHDLRTTKENFRKLQSESLSNWVLAQRSLLHVSQLLEIIATGGRIQPTYEKDASTLARGNLVDSEA